MLQLWPHRCWIERKSHLHSLHVIPLLIQPNTGFTYFGKTAALCTVFNVTCTVTLGLSPHCCRYTPNPANLKLLPLLPAPPVDPPLAFIHNECHLYAFISFHSSLKLWQNFPSVCKLSVVSHLALVMGHSFKSSLVLFLLESLNTWHFFQIEYLWTPLIWPPDQVVTYPLVLLSRFSWLLLTSIPLTSFKIQYYLPPLPQGGHCNTDLPWKFPAIREVLFFSIVNRLVFNNFKRILSLPPPWDLN